MPESQALPLELIVVKCTNLKIDEQIERQEPYVCVEYAEERFHTRTSTDGSGNPVFLDKFTFNLVEGLNLLDVSVYNNNTTSPHDFLGKGRVSLQTVISQGRHESSWPIYMDKNKSAGEVCLVLHCPTVLASEKNQAQAEPLTPKKEKPCSTLCSIWCPTRAIAAWPDSLHIVPPPVKITSEIVIEERACIPEG